MKTISEILFNVDFDSFIFELPLKEQIYFRETEPFWIVFLNLLDLQEELTSEQKFILFLEYFELGFENDLYIGD